MSPGARDILAEFTHRCVALNLAGALHDAVDPVGRRLFNVLVMVVEFDLGRLPGAAERGVRAGQQEDQARSLDALRGCHGTRLGAVDDAHPPSAG